MLNVAGTVDSTGSISGPANLTGSFYLGTYDGSTNNWNGQIDEVGYWKRVLTSGERTSLYGGGSGLAYSSFNSGAAVQSNLLLLGVG
jgi:hypothetical protein